MIFLAASESFSAADASVLRRMELHWLMLSWMFFCCIKHSKWRVALSSSLSGKRLFNHFMMTMAARSFSRRSRRFRSPCLESWSMGLGGRPIRGGGALGSFFCSRSSRLRSDWGFMCSLRGRPGGIELCAHYVVCALVVWALTTFFARGADRPVLTGSPTQTHLG